MIELGSGEGGRLTAHVKDQLISTKLKISIKPSVNIFHINFAPHMTVQY